MGDDEDDHDGMGTTQAARASASGGIVLSDSVLEAAAAATTEIVHPETGVVMIVPRPALGTAVGWAAYQRLLSAPLRSASSPSTQRPACWT